MNSNRLGTLYLVAGAVTISFAPVFVKLTEVPPTTSAFYRLFIGGSILTILAIPSRKFRLPAAAWIGMVGGGLLFGLDLIFWHYSIHYVGPGLATILGNFQVFILAAIGVVLLKERVGIEYVLGTLLAFLGLFILVGGWGDLSSEARAGVIFGLLTAVMYASYLLTLRRGQMAASRAGPLQTIAVVSLVGAVLLGVVMLVGGDSFDYGTPRDLMLLTGYAISAQVFAWVLISKGLPLVPASRAGLILLMQPALAFTWDVVLLGRPTTIEEAGGASLALAGIYLGMRSRQQA